MTEYSTREVMTKWRTTRPKVKKQQDDGNLPYRTVGTRKLMDEEDIIKALGPPPENSKSSKVDILEREIERLQNLLDESKTREARLQQDLDDAKVREERRWSMVDKK